MGLPTGMSTAITPSDTAEIDKQYNAIWLEASGNLAVQYRDGSTHVFGDLAKHTTVLGWFKRVLATGTTVAAGNIYLARLTWDNSR